MYSFHQETVPTSHQNQPSEKPKMTTERPTRRKNFKSNIRRSTQQPVDHQASKTEFLPNLNSKMQTFPRPPEKKSASVQLTVDSPAHALQPSSGTLSKNTKVWTEMFCSCFHSKSLDYSVIRKYSSALILSNYTNAVMHSELSSLGYYRNF